MATADKLTASVDFAALQTDPGYMLELYFAELRKSHAPKSVGKIGCIPLTFTSVRTALLLSRGPRWLGAGRIISPCRTRMKRRWRLQIVGAVDPEIANREVDRRGARIVDALSGRPLDRPPTGRLRPPAEVFVDDGRLRQRAKGGNRLFESQL
uniref:Uncharacterized protein n=1 Tax=Plectus sambesii TaxID=2011161 RepID=A0A914WXY0_9BILA